MIKVTFIEHDGTERPVEAVDGNSLMLAAVSNDVPGIDADCGGCCSCGTCHVYVNEEWLDKLKPMDEDEEDMLDMVDRPPIEFPARLPDHGSRKSRRPGRHNPRIPVLGFSKPGRPAHGRHRKRRRSSRIGPHAQQMEHGGQESPDHAP